MLLLQMLQWQTAEQTGECGAQAHTGWQHNIAPHSLSLLTKNIVVAALNIFNRPVFFCSVGAHGNILRSDFGVCSSLPLGVDYVRLHSVLFFCACVVFYTLLFVSAIAASLFFWHNSRISSAVAAAAQPTPCACSYNFFISCVCVCVCFFGRVFG